MSDHSTIPIKELLESKWFSTDRLLLEHEAPPDLVISQIGGISNISSVQANETIRLENSIRLALLLTKSFANHCDNIENNHEEGCLDSICMEDFFVTLAGFGDSECDKNSDSEHEDDTKLTVSENQITANVDGNDPLSAEIKVAKDEVEGNERSKYTKDYEEGNLQAGFFSSFDKMGAEAYEKFFVKSSNANTFDDLRKDVAHAKVADTAVRKKKDTEGLELGMGYFSRLNDLPEQQGHDYLPSRRVSLPTLAESATEKQSTIPDTEPIPSSNQYKTLIEVDIISPASIDSSKRNSYEANDENKKIKLLGCIMYSVFNNGASPPPHYFPSYIPERTLQLDEISDSQSFDGGRKSKSPRPSEISIYSQLLDSNDNSFPTSICQLLSDMIDIGPDGKATNPFTSFQEIMQDLDEIKSQSYIFLHDNPNKSSGAIPSPPVFGRQYYGRTKELAQFMEVPNRLESTTTIDSLQIQHDRTSTEVIFVSGRAGSGKSHLLNKCSDFLSTQGWLVFSEKFNRGLEYQSQGILCSLFDKIVKKLICMRVGDDQQDAEYSRRISKALSDSLDDSSLRSLASYLPSIFELIDYNCKKQLAVEQANFSHWKLVFLLTQFIYVLLEMDRPIMLVLDDLQWADASTINLAFGHILDSVNNSLYAHRILFVGLYRDNEVCDEHPLVAQLARLRQSESVGIKEMHLSTFSKGDICSMIASELRLTTRIVAKLGDIVHRKSSGNILFAVEVMNSLVRNSVIHFSLKLRRYQWDWDSIISLKTEEKIASFIITIISTLQPNVLQSLRILSCFGYNIDVAILGLLDTSCIVPFGGIRNPLRHLVDIGMIEMAGGLVSFTHDLIQQHVYEGIALPQRQNLHFGIGVFLGSKTTFNVAATGPGIDSLEFGIDRMYISESKIDGDLIISERSLLSIATDQINCAGPEFIIDKKQRILFARWNLQVGKELSATSNFRCALHYYKKGVQFIGQDVWIHSNEIGEQELCLDLYEGAAAASSATSNLVMVEYYANIIFRNVPFEISLPAWVILIVSLESSGKYAEILEKGVNLLRRLNLKIPGSPPNPKEIKDSLVATMQIASQFRIEHIKTSNQSRGILNRDKRNNHNRNLFKIFDAIVLATYNVSSPYLPLLTFEMMQYSLKNEFYEPEAAMAYAGLGYFNILLRNDFESGKYWATVALEILKQSTTSNAARVKWIIYGQILIWFIPLEDSKRNLLEISKTSMKLGDFLTEIYAFRISSRCAFLGGENLAIFSQMNIRSLEKTVTYNTTQGTETAVIDQVMADELRGENSNPFKVYKGLINHEDDLMKKASSTNNISLMMNVEYRRFFSSFWKGDYDAAESSSNVLLSLRMTNILLIYFTFYRGIIEFRRYREDHSEDKLRNGFDAIIKFESWLQHSPSLFENKLLLLNAEQQASLPNIDEAKSLYLSSIKSAKDCGRVHEQGLACELMGRFLLTVANDRFQAMMYMKNAHACYLKWGAFGKAAALAEEHGLDSSNASSIGKSSKHARDVEIFID